MSDAGGFYRRRLAEELKDEEFRTEYETARTEIAQVDSIMRQLDELRVEAGWPKAELARRIGKDPASVRRLFSAEVNPELKTIVAMASALGAKIEVVAPAKRKPRQTRGPRRTPHVA
jgi:ribosome-binding protein aMBF1 (putative translation factor)